MSQAPSTPSITAIILTYNEELHIARCIERVQPLAQRVVIVDSYSSDRTVEIARGLGAEVVQHEFVNQATQMQWALDSLKIDSDWTIRLDADEYLEPALIEELAGRLDALAPDVTGVVLRRKLVFRGRWIRWGSYYPVYLLRVWRSGLARVEQRWMDEHMALLHGHTVTFTDGDFVDENLQTIGSWTEKHNRYASRHMVDFVGRSVGLVPSEPWPTERRARSKRWLRERFYGGAPLYLRSVAYYIYRYIFRLGFLDGRPGFVWHFLHGFWFYVLIDAKIDEARTFLKDNDAAAFPGYLKARHGIDIETPRA